MNPPTTDKFRALLSRGEWDHAVVLLQRLDPNVAADVFLSLPFEEQEILFRRLPAGFAAALAPIFPYYHTYVLLHTRPPAREALLLHFAKRRLSPRGGGGEGAACSYCSAWLALSPALGTEQDPKRQSSPLRGGVPDAVRHCRAAGAGRSRWRHGVHPAGESRTGRSRAGRSCCWRSSWPCFRYRRW